VAAGLSTGTPGKRDRSVWVARSASVPHLAAATMGLAALLYTSAARVREPQVPWRCLPALHGLSDTEGSGRTPCDADAGARSPMQVIVSAIVVNLLNPKLSIFFFAFLRNSCEPTTPIDSRGCSDLSAVFMALTFVVFASMDFSPHRFAAT